MAKKIKSKKQEILEAVKRLADFKLEWQIDKERFPAFFGEGYEPGDEDCPFFSEGCLYNLVGKEDARTVLGLIRKIIISAGLVDDDFYDIF